MDIELVKKVQEEKNEKARREGHERLEREARKAYGAGPTSVEQAPFYQQSRAGENEKRRD